MATHPFKIEVYFERAPSGDAFCYDILLAGKRLITGERDTRAGAKRAARAQLKQLQRDIQKAIDSL